MNNPRIRRAALALLTGVVATCFAASARAQAWLPPKGEVSLLFGYGNIFVNKHFLGTTPLLGGADNPGDSVETDYGHIRSQSIGIGLTYGVTNRLSVSFGVPYIISKYYGTPGENFYPHTIPNDDGNYHGTFQDYRFDVGYQAYNNGSVAIAPFFAAVIPSHSYTFFAHTAAGRDLHEYLLGFSAGGRLDRVLPGSYAEVTYSYAFVEPVFVEGVGNIHHDRSNVFLELGYFLTPSLSVRGIGTGFYTHGGLVFGDPTATGPPVASNPLFYHHDQIGHESGIDLGGGLSYVLSGSTELYVSYLTQAQGRGGHKINDSLSFGVSYSFSPAQVVRRYFPSREPAGAPGQTP
jgi:hypothetical protein